jgi:hypothetical protein
MRKNGLSQWLHYLTALSLGLGTAYSLPASAAVGTDSTVSEQAASALNDIAQQQTEAVEPSTNDWLQWLQWTRIIIIIRQTPTTTVASNQDFGSYAELLDRVNSEA